MLERLGLTIGIEWCGPQGPLRSISDAQTGEPLGHALKSGRLSWWKAQTTAVYELPDESLLLAGRRRRWGEVHVLDANGQLLATVNGRRIYGSDGRLWVERNLVGGVFRLHSGVEAASAIWQGGRVELQFHPRIQNEPPLKMALLAAVL